MRSLVAANGTRTWLETEFGPALSLPVSGRRLAAKSPWQITRGLPLTSARGSLLLSSRRSLADQMLRENPDVTSICETDGFGRVIFMAPYAEQVKLPVYNLSGILPTRSAERTAPVAIVKSKLLSPTAQTPVLTFVADGARSTGKFRLLVTAKAEWPFREMLLRNALSATLTDAGDDNQILIQTAPNGEDFRGVQVDSEPESLSVFIRFLLGRGSPVLNYRSVVIVQAMPYRLSLRRPAPIDNGPFAKAILFPTGAACGLFIFAVRRLRSGFQAIGRRERIAADLRRGHVRKIESLFETVSSSAKHLAHDYKNSLITLTTSLQEIKETVQPLPFDIQNNLSTVLYDLKKFTEMLSLDLAPAAFSGVLSSAAQARSVPPTSSTYLLGVLQQTVEQYASRLDGGLDLRVSAALAGQEPFVAMKYTTLKRIADNLLENAIDACAGISLGPNVEISLSEDGPNISVRFSDNGCGIPADHQAEVFSGFSTKGPTHGKGLQSCKNSAEAEQATLRLVSSVPGGTIMELCVRRVATPSWFASTVMLRNRSVVVTVDDEGSVADYWEQALARRYNEVDIPPEFRPKCIKLKGPGQLIDNHENSLVSGTVFLVDYDFGGSEEMNGIELIESLNLQDRAILVTGHSDEPKILDEVVRKGIKVLPKTYMYSVRFQIEIGVDDV